ncbi:MAG: RNA polymerase sigma factor [Steroidobacteraceae bacterium]
MRLTATLTFPALGSYPEAPTRMLQTMEALDEDAALMLRYQAGDAAAFDALYAHHRGPLYRYLLRLVRNAANANDLFQEVWMRVIANRLRYTPRAKFATFLFHIAHNCAVDHHRRVRAAAIDLQAGEDAVDSTQAPEYERPDRRAEYDQRLASFERALDSLPDEQREAFLLHEETGLDVAQIAQITHVGVETAKSRLRYAIGKLKKSLAAGEPVAKAV